MYPKTHSGQVPECPDIIFIAVTFNSSTFCLTCVPYILYWIKKERSAVRFVLIPVQLPTHIYVADFNQICFEQQILRNTQVCLVTVVCEVRATKVNFPWSTCFAWIIINPERSPQSRNPTFIQYAEACSWHHCPMDDSTVTLENINSWNTD